MSPLAFIGAASAAFACLIPVFHQALERWRTDPPSLEIPATDAEDEAVAQGRLYVASVDGKVTCYGKK